MRKFDSERKFFPCASPIKRCVKGSSSGKKFQTGQFFEGIPSTCYEKTIFGIFQSTCKIKRDNWDSPKIISLAVISKIDVNFRQSA